MNNQISAREDFIEHVERWMPVPGFEGFYEASDTGRVRSVPRLVRCGAHGAIVPCGIEPAPIRHPGTYDGAELRPYQGRPGAMDAFALPSLINGRRVGRGGIDATKGGVSNA